MSVEIIGLVALGLGFFAQTREPSFVFTIFLCSMLFGAAAALLVPGLGTIQPGHLLLAFVCLRALTTPRLASAMRSNFNGGSPTFWLFCTCVYGAFSAYFFSRLFANQMEIIAVSSPLYGENIFKLPLSPSNGNITQTVYLFGDLACFTLFLAFASTGQNHRKFVQALLVYGSLDIAFALTDVITTRLGVSSVLGFMRNANYVVYVDSQVANVQRIIGSFTEASAFAYATVGVTCVALRLWLGGIHRRWSFAVFVFSLGLLLFSTASTAYVALVPALGLIVAGSIARSLKNEASAQDAAFLVMSPCLLCLGILFVLLNPVIYGGISDFFKDILFQKSLSSSGIDRAKLNADAIAIFWQTYGLGIGLGSVRTSSFVTASLSNLGLLGTSLYVTFLVLTLLKSYPDDCTYMKHVRSAARCGCVGILCAAATSGALVDLGLPFFAMAALASVPSAIVDEKTRLAIVSRNAGLGGMVKSAAPIGIYSVERHSRRGG